MLPHLSFFFTFFLTNVLPYLSFSLKIDPLYFFYNVLLTYAKIVYVKNTNP